MAIKLNRVFTTTIEVTCDICKDRASISVTDEPLKVNKELVGIGWKYDYEYGQDICPSCQENFG